MDFGKRHRIKRCRNGEIARVSSNKISTLISIIRGNTTKNYYRREHTVLCKYSKEVYLSCK